MEAAPTLNPDAMVYVEFYSEAVEDAPATQREGRPIFVEREFVRVQQAGDRRRAHVAPAHEPFQLDRRSGGHVTYAERYPEQYQAFKRKESVLASGTPIDLVPHLTASRKAELKAAQVLTAEALASLPDNIIARFGPGTREAVRATKDWLVQAKEQAGAAALAAENASMKDRLAALEAKLAARDAAPAEDSFDAMSDDDLRERLAEAGVQVRTNASRDRLLAAVRDL